MITRLLVVLLMASPAFAQEQQPIVLIDSLYNALKSDPDQTLIEEMDAVLRGYAQGHKDTTIYYGNELVKFAEQINSSNGLGRAYNILGLAYELNGDLDRGIENYLKALEYTEPMEESSNLTANIYNNLSIAYSYKGDMEKSIEYLLKMIPISEANEDTSQLATGYNNLGLRYIQMSSPKLAIKYLQQARELNVLRGATGKIGLNDMNIGSAYVMLKNYDSGSYLLRQSVDRLKEAGRDFDRLIAYQLLASMYYRIDAIDSAKLFNQLSLDLGDTLQDPFSISDSKRLQAMLMMKEGRYDEAIPILEEAKEISESINYQNQMSENYKYLGRAYAEVGNYGEAQRYYQLTIEIMDSVLTEESDDARMKLAEYQQEKYRQSLLSLEKDAEIQRLRADRSETINIAAGIAGVLLLILLGGVFNRYRYIRKTNKIIEVEKQRSDDLLLNILPTEVAEELKDKGKASARLYNDVTILFTDFKNFTEFSSKISPAQVVEEIDNCYRAFDEIVSKYSIEKIKTIGDSYMAAAGLPSPSETHAEDMVMMALEIRDFMESFIQAKKDKDQPYFEIRIGIHSGPVVAGIVGIKKFAYDIWGDTVNIAARMESNSDAMKINISESTYNLVKDKFSCTPRGPVNVKGKGELMMYFVDSKI